MEFTESRFPHLLQPIRELTKNWDIDVASELNDYLEELDTMCITFDGGKTRLNFAEAALLIQGSACIYSKKVELLHSLVHQTLEYINDRNKKRTKQSAESQEDEEAAGEHDADHVFTALHIDVSGNPMKADSTATVSVAPLPPESLIPLQTTEKQKLPLLSVSGDLLCSQKDFRINLFVPGAQDVILLTLGSAPSRLVVDPAEPRGEDAPAEVEDDAVENFLPLEDHNMDPDQGPEEHVDRHQVSVVLVPPRAPEPGPESLTAFQASPREPRPARAAPVNVWALCDPYAVLQEDRPPRPGRCHAAPEGLEDGGKRKRRRAAPPDFRTWFTKTFDPPEPKLRNGPASPDLNYIYLSTMRTRIRAQRTLRRREGVVVSDEELRRTFLQLEEGPNQQGEEPVDLLGGDGDSDNEQDDLQAADFTSAEAQSDELSYEDLVKLRVEQLVVTCRGFTQETALSRRVRDWEDKLRPQLLLQEQRSVFDIHDYGDRIVAALSGVGRRRSFSSLVAGLDNYEACKYLLASLQLANDLTVGVSSAGPLEDGVDTMSLKLLSTERATDRFKSLGAGP